MCTLAPAAEGAEARSATACRALWLCWEMPVDPQGCWCGLGCARGWRCQCCRPAVSIWGQLGYRAKMRKNVGSLDTGLQQLLCYWFLRHFNLTGPQFPATVVGIRDISYRWMWSCSYSLYHHSCQCWHMWKANSACLCAYNAWPGVVPICVLRLWALAQWIATAYLPTCEDCHFCKHCTCSLLSSSPHDLY